jgi:hypothetical protein
VLASDDGGQFKAEVATLAKRGMSVSRALKEDPKGKVANAR